MPQHSPPQLVWGTGGLSGNPGRATEDDPTHSHNQSSTAKSDPKIDAKQCVDRVQRWYTGKHHARAGHPYPLHLGPKRPTEAP